MGFEDAGDDMNLELRKEQSAPADGCKQAGGAAEALTVAPASHAECLHYLADMVGELKSIAERLGNARLAAILALAHREAQLQRESP